MSKETQGLVLGWMFGGIFSGAIIRIFIDAFHFSWDITSLTIMAIFVIFPIVFVCFLGVKNKDF